MAVRAGKNVRRRLQTVNHVGVHLQFGKGAAHAVPVHHRQAELDRRNQRSDRIAAADFGRNHVRRLLAGVLLQDPHTFRKFRPFARSFDADRRRADPSD